MKASRTKSAPLTKDQRDRIKYYVKLVVESYVERGFFYNSHLDADPDHLFSKISAESKTAKEAVTALYNDPKGDIGKTFHSAIVDQCPERILYLMTQLPFDEPTKAIADGIIEQLERYSSRAKDSGSKLRN